MSVVHGQGLACRHERFCHPCHAEALLRSRRSCTVRHVKPEVIREVLFATKPPVNFYTSDGRVVYVDHPESVLVGESLVAIGSGADGASAVMKQIILVSPDHVVRIEPTKRRALRQVA
jgi:hypothetical protein